ncbi:MAG TPA: thioredoxin domain-containing protein [Flavisolibacter sp.]|jgi:protein-disulfide isomerase
MQKKEELPVIPSREMIIGPLEAPVRLTMFGDYESPETRQLHEVIKKILTAFTGKVNFVFRHFPLTQVHQKAHKAAEAAIAAGQEGKFWEMHEQLLEHPKGLGIISLKSHAREVGVVNKRFLEQLMNGDFGWYVQDDLQEGIKRGVREIPVLFINDEMMDKPLTLNRINKVIREELAATAKPKGAESKRAAA